MSDLVGDAKGLLTDAMHCVAADAKDSAKMFALLSIAASLAVIAERLDSVTPAWGTDGKRVLSVLNELEYAQYLGEV